MTSLHLTFDWFFVQCWITTLKWNEMKRTRGREWRRRQSAIIRRLRFAFFLPFRFIWFRFIRKHENRLKSFYGYYWLQCECVYVYFNVCPCPLSLEWWPIWMYLSECSIIIIIYHYSRSLPPPSSQLLTIYSSNQPTTSTPIWSLLRDIIIKQKFLYNLYHFAIP